MYCSANQATQLFADISKDLITQWTHDVIRLLFSHQHLWTDPNYSFLTHFQSLAQQHLTSSSFSSNYKYVAGETFETYYDDFSSNSRSMLFSVELLFPYTLMTSCTISANKIQKLKVNIPTCQLMFTHEECVEFLATLPDAVEDCQGDIILLPCETETLPSYHDDDVRGSVDVTVNHCVSEQQEFELIEKGAYSQVTIRTAVPSNCVKRVRVITNRLTRRLRRHRRAVRLKSLQYACRSGVMSWTLQFAPLSGLDEAIDLFWYQQHVAEHFCCGLPGD